MTKLFTALLLLAGIFGTMIGMGMLTQATQGVGAIAASACALILARIVLANSNHNRMMELLDANHARMMETLKTITDHVK